MIARHDGENAFRGHQLLGSIECVLQHRPGAHKTHILLGEINSQQPANEGLDAFAFSPSQDNPATKRSMS